MGRLNLLGGQINLQGGQMSTQLTCSLPPCALAKYNYPSWQNESILNNAHALENTVQGKDSGREGPACRVISCRMERSMNYCVYAHLRQLIAISRHFWSVLKRSRHTASESHVDIVDASEIQHDCFWIFNAAKSQNKTFVDKTKQKNNQTNKQTNKATQTKQIICVLIRNLGLIVFFN